MGRPSDWLAAGADELDAAIRDIRAAVLGARAPQPTPRTDPGW